MHSIIVFIISVIVSFNAFANSNLPNDLQNYFSLSIARNIHSTSEKLIPQSEENIEWKDIYEIAVSEILKNNFKNKDILTLAFKAFGTNTELCKKYESELSNYVKNNFSDVDAANLNKTLNNECNLNSTSNSEIPNLIRSIPVTPDELMEYFINLTKKLPSGLQAEFQKPLFDTKEIILLDASSGYGNGGITASNQGLINYSSKQIQEDKKLIYDAIRFYAKIMGKSGGDTNHGTVWNRPSKDYWKIALEAADNNPWRAIRVLGFKAHDVTANDLNPKFWLDPSTKKFGAFINSISHAEKELFQIGSIAEIYIPKKLLSKFTKLKLRMSELNVSANLRAAHYHFIAGMYVTEELLRKGNDRLINVKTPTVISDVLGYAYKRISMERYMSSDANQLLKQKCWDNIVCKKPNDWDELRYKKAKLNLDLNIAFLDLTAWQHRAGAKFAWKSLHSN